MEEKTVVHSKQYDLLHNRMTNGVEFYKPRALEAITAAALDMTQDEVDELTALTNASGVDVLDKDRLNAVSEQSNHNRADVDYLFIMTGVEP